MHFSVKTVAEAESASGSNKDECVKKARRVALMNQ